MLKRLVIVVVFLLFMAPLPGQTSSSASEGSAKSNGNSQSKNHPSAPAVTVSNPARSPENAEHAREIAAKETEHSVTLASVPPLTIKDKQKTFLDHVYDWGPWFFGLFLAIVGGIQLKLLRVTWEAIKEQKAEAAIQTGILKEAAESSKIQAKAAMGIAVPTLVLVSLEFAEQNTPELAARLVYPIMKVVVKNYGKTPAILKSYGVNYFCDGMQPLKSVPPSYHFEAGDVIESGIEYVLDDAAYAPHAPFSVEDMVLILNGEKTFGVEGSLNFTDVFGSPVREFYFCKELIYFRPDGTNLLWMDYGQGEKYRLANTEQSQNPN